MTLIFLKITWSVFAPVVPAFEVLFMSLLIVFDSMDSCSHSITSWIHYWVVTIIMYFCRLYRNYPQQFIIDFLGGSDNDRCLRTWRSCALCRLSEKWRRECRCRIWRKRRLSWRCLILLILTLLIILVFYSHVFLYCACLHCEPDFLLLSRYFGSFSIFFMHLMIPCVLCSFGKRH